MIWDFAVELCIHTVLTPRRPSGGMKRLAFDILERAERLVSHTDAELRSAANTFRYEALAGARTRTLLPEVFALVIEASRRQLGMKHHFAQVLGGITLQKGHIAEIQTGEGKTLIATLPMFLNALSGNGAHLATANDYLAKRDCEWMRPVYEFLGLSVGAITGDMSPSQRRAAYACDITYGTAREFGFDFLRDRLALRTSGKNPTPLFAEQLQVDGGHHAPQEASSQQAVTVQRHPLHYLLVDEADSLLIDEARTPLIISSQAADGESIEALFRWCAAVAQEFQSPEFIDHDEATGARELSPAGFRQLRALSKPATINDVPMSELADAVVRAVHVAETLQRDQHYVVRDGEVLIVDEYTGRIADGRKWRNGIHQAVEAREQLKLSPFTQHAARITVQELVSQYERFSGMTGSAQTASLEFWRVYDVPVNIVQTHKFPQRQYLEDLAFVTSEERWNAIVEDVIEKQAAGRPVLIGTRTIEQSELLSRRLSAANIEHQVLNARNHAKEAEIVAEAGRPGCVTVATNMAGRGTDIRLQGDAAERGGLHVIISELNPSARIDTQLAGRCARQGDPGSCQRFMSLEDDILSEGLGPEAAEEIRKTATAPLSNSVISKFIKAQYKLDRKHSEERSLLVRQTRQQIRQLTQMGLDPYLDGV